MQRWRERDKEGTRIHKLSTQNLNPILGLLHMLLEKITNISRPKFLNL